MLRPFGEIGTLAGIRVEAEELVPLPVIINVFPGSLADHPDRPVRGVGAVLRNDGAIRVDSPTGQKRFQACSVGILQERCAERIVANPGKVGEGGGEVQ